MFPIQPLPNESSYPLLARIHQISGSKSPLNTLKNVLGIRGYKPLNGLPTHLENLLLNIEYTGDVNTYIEKHTHFPLYKSFLPAKRQSYLLEAMHKSGATNSRLGILRANVNLNDTLKYCPRCYETDIDRYGVAYWHREHCLAGIRLCNIHDELLFECIIRDKTFGDRALELPGLGERLSIKSEGSLYRQRFIVDQYNQILSSNYILTIDRKAYHQLLKQQGYLTSEGHVRQKQLEATVKSWLKPVKSIKPFDNLNSRISVERNWLATLVSDRKGFHHPMNHVVVWGALGLEYRDIINEYFHVGEQDSLDLKIRHFEPLTAERVARAINCEGSITKAARVLGCCVTTMAVAAEKFGIPYQRKTQYIDEVMKKKVASAAQQGKTSSEISAKHGISVCSVNRVLRAIS